MELVISLQSNGRGPQRILPTARARGVLFLGGDVILMHLFTLEFDVFGLRFGLLLRCVQKA